VANGGHSSGTGTLSDWGENQSGQDGGYGSRGENGRNVKLTQQQTNYARKLIEQGGSHHDTVAKSLNVSRQTLYRACMDKRQY
jgi:DNA invertase Pin-like site-specific DNA recombinase